MDAPGGPEFDELSDSLAARVKPELEPDERLIWAVQVDPARLPPGATRPWTLPGWSLFFFSASGGFFALFRYRRAANPNEDLGGLVAMIAGGMAIGVILAISAWNAWSGRRRLRNQGIRPTYALTDRRAILWTLPVWPQTAVKAGAITVRSIPRGSIKTVYRVEYPDGSGDVVFGGSNEEGVPEAMFEGIAEVRRVEDLARRMLLATGEMNS